MFIAQTMHKLRQDIADASDCFSRLAIPTDSLHMDDVSPEFDKGQLLEILREMWSCPDPEVPTMRVMYDCTHDLSGVLPVLCWTRQGERHGCCMPAAGFVTHLNRLCPLSGGTEGLTGIRGSWVSVFSCVKWCLIGVLVRCSSIVRHTEQRSKQWMTS